MLHQIFKWEHFSHKNTKKRAAEQDKEVAHFTYCISQYKTAQLSYLDKSAKDERTYFKLYVCMEINTPYYLLWMYKRVYNVTIIYIMYMSQNTHFGSRYEPASLASTEINQ